MSALVGSVTSSENFTKDDAIEFGRKIGLPIRVINEVIEENQQLRQSVRGASIASALYQEAERRSTLLSHRFVEKVTDGLQEVCDRISTSDDVKSNFEDKIKNIKHNSMKRNVDAGTMLAAQAVQETG